MKFGKLKNGLRYVIDKNGSRYSANIIFMVGVGSRNEVKKKHGLAHFLEHMLFKGTKRRPTSQAVSDDIYKCGAETNAMTTYDVTGYYITTSSDYIDTQLDILSDMLFNSHFKGIKSEKDVVISENKKNETSPSSKLEMRFYELLFKGTTFEHDTGGSNRDIKKFTKTDVKKFYDKYYSPDNIVLSIAGKVPKNVESLIKKYFDKRRKNREFDTETYHDFMLLQKEPRFKSLIKDVDQAQIAIGFPAYNYNEKKYFVLQIISNVLAGNMSSRLFIKLREKLGLVYTVSSEVDSFKDTGMFMISFGTFLNKVKEATNAVLKEIRSIKRRGITAKELENNVNYLIGIEAIQNEDNETVAYSNAYEYLLYNKILTNTQRKKIFKSVTLDDIKKVAKEIFDYNRLNYVVISNQKYKQFIKKI